jgi:hypothetical protein
MKKTNNTIALFLILAMALTFNPMQSSAKYKDKSDELPGMVSDEKIYTLAGIAAVGVGVPVFVIINKNKQKKTSATIIQYRNNNQPVLWENQMGNVTTGDKTTSDLSASKTTLLTIPECTFMQQVENAAKTMPIDLVVSPMNTGCNFATNQSNGVQIGIRIRF